MEIRLLLAALKVRAVSSGVVWADGTVLVGAALPLTVMGNVLVSDRAPPVPEFPLSLLMILKVAVPEAPAVGVKTRLFRSLLMLASVPVKVIKALFVPV